METNLSRRDFTKALGAVAVVSVAGTTLTVQNVAATESGHPELNTDADVGGDSTIRLTTYEYDGDHLSHEQTVEVEDGQNTYVLDDLEGDRSYDYDFELGIGTDEEESPKFHPMTFRIPISEEDFTFSSYTDEIDWVAKPEDAEISFDEYRLRKFQPRFIMTQDARRRSQGLFGYVMESAEHDTFVCCYWHQMTHQEALPMASANSHLGDHEPVYVFVDEDSEEVETVVYTGYHWFAAEISGEDANLSQARAGYPTHVNLRVVDPWNHYTHEPDERGAFVDIESWGSHREAWKRNGFYDPAEVESIENPWTMLDRDGWWADRSINKQMAGVWRRIGIRGGGDADPLRGDDAGSGLPSFSLDDLWPFGDDEDDD